MQDGATVDVALTKPSENNFKVFVFDAMGGPLQLENNRIVITRTAATIDAIPSSSSIGIEVLDRIGGRPVLDYLVRDGEALPRKGQKKFKATEALRAGGGGSINFKIWEGEIESPVADNRLIGLFSIGGHDFSEGVIAAGTDLICDYEVLDSGNVVLEVTAPSIGGSFRSGKNFYSRQAAEIDYTAAARQVREDAEAMRRRIEAVVGKVQDSRLEEAQGRVNRAASLDAAETDPETSKEAIDSILEAKRLLAEVRKSHLKEMRKVDLDSCVSFFNSHVRQHARPAEVTAFENLSRTATRSIEGNSTDFEQHLGELKGKNFEILWRQDWFVVDRFQRLAASGFLFTDRVQHADLVAAGKEAISADDIDKLAGWSMN